MEKTQKQIEEWTAYRLSVLEQKSKSDEDFEKYITFIAAGALGLTVTFIDKISPLKESVWIWSIIMGWFCLAVTLFVNLYSHYRSSKNNEKAIHDIDENLLYEVLVENIKKRNKTISRLNLSSIILLGLGIFFILLFTSINAYNG